MTEDDFYTMAVNEIRVRRQEPSIWARALAEGDGDEAKTAARYIRFRVEQLKQQVESYRSGRRKKPPLINEKASALSRLIARWIDLMIWGILFGLLLRLVGAGETIASIHPWFTGPIIFFFMPFAEALAIHYLGSTPGKAALGIKIFPMQSLRPDEEQRLFFRSLSVLIKGCAIGLPFLSIGTFYIKRID